MTRAMPTTIRDVAREAQVSVTTVSQVLNGTRFVSDAARALVEANRGAREKTLVVIAALLPSPAAERGGVRAFRVVS